MSTSSEFEPAARQDYGPTPSSENVYEHVLDHKLAENMSVPIRTPVLRPLPLPSTPPEGDPEPDSTDPDNIAPSSHANLDKEVEYHISEKECDTEMPLGSLTGIVRIEEATLDSVSHIAYPIIQEADDSSDAHFVDNPSTTLIQAPLNTAIVQNVTKLPQNFTINVDATVGNITAIQNVSQDVSSAGQTLWLPTLLATSTATDSKSEDERSQAGVSQFIITSESYVTSETAGGQAGPRRANILTETGFISRSKGSKVQILSNVAIPKNLSYSQQYPQVSKELSPVYATQNHVYKLNTNVISQKQFSNSVLTTKPPKSQSMIGSSMSPTVSSPVKNLSYSHTITKGTNVSKSLNKVNNGANLNAVVATSPSNTPCHILSRVVSGPNRLSVHSGRKSVNTFKGAKNSSLSSGQKQSRAIKIIQQTGSTHKTEGKSWPVTSVATYKNQQPSYGVVDSNTSKIIQRVGSPTHKSQAAMTLQKATSKGERLVLQSPCGPVLISTAPISTIMHKGPHYVQSGPTPNLRYVHTYGPESNQLSNVSQVSANQQLTAQILQSLSQPKLLMPAAPKIINHSFPPMPLDDNYMDIKPANQRRVVFGDPSTLLTADDIIGMEERPNLPEELRRYSFHSLALVMLDHTYSQPAQKQPCSPPAAPPSAVPAPASPAPLAEPQSPVKQTSPVVTSSTTYELQHLQPSTLPTSTIGTLIPVSSYSQPLQLGSLYKSQDEDAGSVISSVEGERRGGDAAGDRGSDTETAPEVEEEGKTRCCCDFSHDDGYMICCDRCGEWQHVDCMGIDRNNIPDAYMCELCQPRPVDRRHARSIQMRKREELSAIGVASDSDSSGCSRLPGQRRKRLLTVTTYTNTSGSCVTTYNSNVPVLTPLPAPTLALPKRGPKRPKKPEVVRKGAKRKLSEKRVKRKKEMMLNRSKYNASLSNSSHWQDSYESAMTNHYSPELRAKIMKYSSKLGSTANMAAAITAHLCTTVPHAGGKILIATKDLKENTSVIELRGKYMLSTQHRPQLQHAPRSGGQKPGPFVFFYRLPKDNTQVCIDTRTYGNEARFVRRSCKPNAELQHCIVKGALHVYLVTTGTIQSNTEITVGHDGTGGKQPCACGNPKHCKVNGLNPMLSRKSVDYPPREKRSRNRTTSLAESPMSPPPTAPFSPLKEIPPLIQHIKSEKKSPIKQEISPISPIKHAIPVLNFDRPIKAEFDVKEDQPELELFAAEEMKPEVDEPDSPIIAEPLVKEEPPPASPEDVKTEPIEQPIAPVVEEKPQEILKPAEEVKEYKECLETEQKITTLETNIIKSDTKIIKPDIKIIKPDIKTIKPDMKIIKPDMKIIKPDMKIIKPDMKIINPEIEPMFSDDEKIEKLEKLSPKEEMKDEDEKPLAREVLAKSACHDRSARTSRTTCVNQDSLDDKTDDSQDKLITNTKEKDKKKMTREERKMEAIMKAFERMEKAEQRKQEVKERQKRRESDPQPHLADRDEDDDLACTTRRRRKRKGRARTTSQSNRRRLNSADSDMVTSGDEAPAVTSPRPPRRVSAPSQHAPAPHPPAPHPDLDRDSDPHEHGSEDLSLSSACLLVEAAVGCVESAFKLPKTKKTMATEWVGRSPEPDRTPSPYREPYRSPLVPATSLESLVRVASTMIGDLSGGQSEPEEMVSPPRTPGRDRSRPPKKSKRITRSTPLELPQEVPPPAAMPQHSAKKRWLRQAISEEIEEPNNESPPSEMVTPLKKRRLARESLSCDPAATPCTDVASPRLTSASDDSPVKDERTVYLRDRTRTRSDSGQGSDDHEPCHMDHVLLNLNLRGPHATENIRRIIGVPDEPPPAKPDELRTINNNVEDSSYTTAVPMDIDTSITPQTPTKDEELVAGDKVTSSRSHSADTSGNSSPQPDDMDDIQKKIHSFHTENILMLKSRNKKPPKEKRKKVNLNFDLNMVDDQISVQLRTETDPPLENGDVHEDSEARIHYVTTENIPLPPVETIPLPATEHIPLPDEPEALPPDEVRPGDALEETSLPAPRPPSLELINLPAKVPEPVPSLYPPLLDMPSVPFASRFNSTGLFSGIFNNMSQTYSVDSHINENVPCLSVMKSLEGAAPPGDELRSVQEILSRVNNMDSNNSVLLSGVLKSTEQATPPLLSPGPKPFSARQDPRLNPQLPSTDKPKPVRRKLSISEYRKRHKGSCAGSEGGGALSDVLGSWSSESSNAGSLSPLRLEAAAAAAADDLEQRLHRALATPTGTAAASTCASTPAAHCTHIARGKGVFDAQPTASERQRENLSSRLRREFGLALPEDESARPAPPALALAPALPAAPGAAPGADLLGPLQWGRRGA